VRARPPKNYIIGGETRLAILKLFINLTPLIPLSLARRGGGIKKEGLTPLLNAPKSKRVKERLRLS